MLSLGGGLLGQGSATMNTMEEIQAENAFNIMSFMSIKVSSVAGLARTAWNNC
jgi:hypothetical protein